MPMYDYECSECGHLEDSIEKVDTLTIPCGVCGEPSNRVYTSCATHLTTIVPDYPGCKKKRAGYVHTHGDRPRTKVQGRGFTPPS